MDIYFHKNLRHLRKKSGHLQSEISDTLGIVPSAYGRLERGEGYPKMESLIKLVEIFQVNLHDLVFTDLEKHPQGAPTAKPDPAIERTVLRLNRELDELSAQVIARADPGDLEGLVAYRAELIRRFPEQARALGITE